MQPEIPIDPKVSEEFWTWFDHNKDAIATAMTSGEEQTVRETIGETDTHMQAVTPGISFLFGQGKDANIFVVTAGGDIDFFPNVNAFVAGAPAIDGWKIVAFRPKSEESVFRIKMGGITLSTEDIQFQAFEVEDGLGITLYPNGMTEDNRKVYSTATVTILDHLLGEYDAVTKIQSLMVEPPSTAFPDAPTRPMIELPEFLDQWAS